MRLLKRDGDNQFSLTKYFAKDEIPPYAILSHTWGSDDDEVTFADIQSRQGQDKAGYAKLQFCAEQVQKDGIEHFWVDTCCIDRANHTELSKAITSMFRWYRDAQKCYVYLSDVSSPLDDVNGAGDEQPAWLLSLRTSRWFTRGWTLQELLAPEHVEFFSYEGRLLGTKKTLAPEIREITTIPISALDGAPLSQFTVAERLRWAENRMTKEEEDMAYCLQGIFDVSMPLIYGEGDKAFRRLQKEIHDQLGSLKAVDRSADHNIQNDTTSKISSFGLCLASAPLITSDEFIGRSTEVDAIHSILQPNQATAIEQRHVVLGGVGGVGKTQLAIAYARQHGRSYTSVFWLNATSEATVRNSYQSIASTILPSEKLEKLDEGQILAQVKEWLSHQRNNGWLLIFDNHDDPDQFNLKGFYPDVGHGSIIITTRLPDRVTGQQVRIRPLKEINECLQILKSRSGRKDTGSDALELVKRLGGLPLALVTAGAYLRKSIITYQQYLDVYEQQWKIDPRRQLKIHEYRDRTLYTTWNLSYSRLMSEDLEAAQMLKLLAYFDNQEICYDLISAGLSDQSLDCLQASLTDRISFENTMQTLVDYCLIDIQSSNESYSMHSCIHDWTLGELNQDINSNLLMYAFNCVVKGIARIGFEVLKQITYAPLTRHATRLTHHRFKLFDQLSGMSSDFLTKVVSVTVLFTAQLQLSEAELVLTRLLAAHESTRGPQHGKTLDAVERLGLIYHYQEKHDKALHMYQRALVIYEVTLGHGHFKTLRIADTIGSLYRDQGKLDDAIQMYQRALDGYEKLVGPGHAETLDLVDNIGRIHLDKGELEKADQMFTRALAGCERMFGPDHTNTLWVLGNIGSLYYEEGRLEAASRTLQQVLIGREKLLGPDHIETSSAVNDLGNVYYRQGRLHEANQMYQRGLAAHEKWGCDQASVLTLQYNIARVYWDQGKLEEAAQLFTRVYVGQKRALGPEHPHTLQVVKDLDEIQGTLHSTTGSNYEGTDDGCMEGDANVVLALKPVLGKRNRSLSWLSESEQRSCKR